MKDVLPSVGDSQGRRCCLKGDAPSVQLGEGTPTHCVTEHTDWRRLSLVTLHCKFIVVQVGSAGNAHVTADNDEEGEDEVKP